MGEQESKYDNILPDETAPPIHVNHLKYIKLLMDKQDLWTEQYITTTLAAAFDIRDLALTEAVRDVIKERDEKVLLEISAVKDALNNYIKINQLEHQNIGDALSDYRRDIDYLKDYASGKNTIIRMAIVFGAAIAAFLGIHKWFLS